MLNIQKYLLENGIRNLEESHNIILKHYPECILLSYGIGANKEDILASECRGLILSKDYKRILCKSFTRFFNYGEIELKDFRFERSIVYEKVDGSLLRFWNDGTRWNMATRNMAYAEGNVNLMNYSFRECVLKCFHDGEYDRFISSLDSDYTYVFEFVSPENRVIHSYGSDYALYYLACFDNRTGEEVEKRNILELECIRYPRVYPLKEYKEILAYMDNFSDTDEGFVLHDRVSGIRVKIKNSRYLSLCTIRSNGKLNLSRVIEMIFAGEESEYLTYFPEDKEVIMLYKIAYDKMLHSIESIYKEIQNLPKSTHDERKAFANIVTRYPFSDVLFAMGRGYTLADYINHKNLQYKIRLIQKFA